MALESYVVTQNVRAPYVRVTGMAHRPQEIRMKTFRKGDIIRGEMKHANNKPAFVLVDGVLVVPIDVLRKVITTEIKSGADGTAETDKPKKSILVSSNPKVKYLDAIILGGLVGVGAVYLSEKQGWIAQPENKYRLYGGIAGALAGAYMVYRFKNNKPVVKKIEE